MQTFELYLPDIFCPNCVAPIENVLTECKYVKSVKVNYLDHTAIVEIEDNQVNTENLDQLKKAVTDIGFPCEGLLEVTEGSAVEHEELEFQRIDLQAKKAIRSKKAIRQYWINGALGVIAGVAVVCFCIWGMGLPLIAMYLVGVASSALTLYFGKETYKQAYTQLTKTKSLTMDTLFAVSTLLAIGVSCAGFIVPWLPMMFDAALLILGFKNIGKAIQESAKQSLTEKSFQSYAPAQVVVEKAPGILKKMLVKHLWPGNIILVYSGETIPVDGVCLSENASVYNTIVTGRTIPQPIPKNFNLYAGSVVPADVKYIKIRVTDREADSYLALLDKRTKQAELEKAPLETSATKVLQYFVPLVFAIAIVSAIAVGFFLSPVAAIQCGIAVLVSACPCAMGLITPYAIKVGIEKALDHGVSFKSGKSIEAAAEVDTIVFDLNGTLTTGVPKVIKSTVPKEMLQYLVKMESESTHPIAQAICDFAKKQQYAAMEYKSFTCDKSHHAGIAATIDNKNFIVGNRKMMQAHQINTDAYDNKLAKENAEHIIYFAKENKIVGYVLLEDPLREDAIETVKELHRQGKQIHICTGADVETAKKYAVKLDIPEEYVKGNYLGESKDPAANTKTNYIRSLKGRRVCMIGDAGNDATAVAACDFGIAIKSAAGNKITQDKAGATINQDSLWAIVNAFVIAKQTISNIKQNLAISISYNLLAMIAFSGLLVAVGFAVNPVIGAFLMIIQTGLILANVKRFKRQPVPSLPGQMSAKNEMDEDSWISTHKKLNKDIICNKYEKIPCLTPSLQESDVDYESLFKNPTPCINESILTLEPRKCMV